MAFTHSSINVCGNIFLFICTQRGIYQGGYSLFSQNARYQYLTVFCVNHIDVEFYGVDWQKKSREHTTPDRAILIAWDNLSR